MQTAPHALDEAGPRCTRGEVLAALAPALDLAGGRASGHALRACVLGMRIGAALGLGPGEAADLHAVLLLKDMDAGIARGMGVSGTVAEGIAAHRDACLAGAPLLSRIALVAQEAEIALRAQGRDGAAREVEGQSGTRFDPAVARAAAACLRARGLRTALAAPGLAARAAALGPPEEGLDDDGLDAILRGFARLTDARSAFTQGHSERVADCAARLAGHLALGPAARRRLWRAGLVHDIGKLGVPARILDKRTALTRAEFAVVRRHPLLSRRLLAGVPLFRPMAEVAAAHHERLDGRGYPRGLAAGDLTLEMRILTVADVFDALTSARPYKPALPPDEVRAIMEAMAGTALDGEVLRALWAVADGAP